MQSISNQAIEKFQLILLCLLLLAWSLNFFHMKEGAILYIAIYFLYQIDYYAWRIIPLKKYVLKMCQIFKYLLSILTLSPTHYPYLVYLKITVLPCLFIVYVISKLPLIHWIVTCLFIQTNLIKNKTFEIILYFSFLLETFSFLICFQFFQSKYLFNIQKTFWNAVFEYQKNNISMLKFKTLQKKQETQISLCSKLKLKREYDSEREFFWLLLYKILFPYLNLIFENLLSLPIKKKQIWMKRLFLYTKRFLNSKIVSLLSYDVKLPNFELQQPKRMTTNHIYLDAMLEETCFFFSDDKDKSCFLVNKDFIFLTYQLILGNNNNNNNNNNNKDQTFVLPEVLIDLIWSYVQKQSLILFIERTFTLHESKSNLDTKYGFTFIFHSFSYHNHAFTTVFSTSFLYGLCISYHLEKNLSLLIKCHQPDELNDIEKYWKEMYSKIYKRHFLDKL